MPEVNWMAVLTAAVSSFLLGGIWYGPLFGRVWMRAAGVGEDAASQGSMGRTFGGAFVLQLIAASVLAMFIGSEMAVGPAVAAAGSVGLCWVGTALGVIYLFERRPLTHWMVNAGYHFTAYLIMGVIIAVWR